MNLAELAENSMQRLGKRMVLDFEGEQFTNVKLLDWAKRLQSGFSRLGLKRGEIVPMCLINHPLVYPVFQGIFRSGGTAVPVMFQLAMPEVRYILEDTKALGIVTDETNLKKVREAAQGLQHLRWIVIRGGKDNPEASPPEYSLETLLQSDLQNSLPKIDDGDVALMLYTAGTTGKPKGVMLTHSNFMAMAEAANEAAELDTWAGPRIAMSAMPMAHIFGVGVMITGYMVPERLAGGYGVQMAWFETERFMQLVQKHRCTTMAAVPTMLALILSHPKVKEYDLSSLTEVVCGAAPLPKEIARAFSEQYGCRVREIYGLTENTGLGTANRLSDPYKPGTIGKPYYNTEVQIFADDDRSLPAGERGEIVLRGPAVMKGYYNRPKETAEALRSGWLHTGDIGYYDKDGYFYVVDRKKDMIIRGGENIYPAELENIIYYYEGVAEAAVIGTPDPVFGENVVAYVVPKQGVNLSEKELMDFVKTKTSSFKAPSKIYFIDALPKSGVGKILRRELRDKAAKE